MQGQRALLAILVAAFATLYGDATILLFFVLPMPARWFLWLEIGLAFVAYLASKDLAGFVGICAAVGVTVLTLPGSPARLRLRRRYLSWRARRIERRLARLARRRGIAGGAPRRRPRRRPGQLTGRGQACPRTCGVARQAQRRFGMISARW